MTPMQASIYLTLKAKRGRDVSIAALFYVTYDTQDISDYRVAQQRICAHIARINRALEGEKIVPGNLKRTYRLIKL